MRVKRRMPSLLGYLFSALSVIYYFLYTQGYALTFPETRLLFAAGAVIGCSLGWLRMSIPLRWHGVYDAIWLTLICSFFAIPGAGLTLLLIFCVVLLLDYFLSENSMIILTWMAAAFCCAMAFTPLRVEKAPTSPHSVALQYPVPSLHTQLPPVVHLILDEHEGMMGLSTKTMAIINALAKKHQLTVYSNAYSRYSTTLNSIPNLLNFTESTVYDEYVLQQNHDPHLGGSLQQNRYFVELAKAGYQINVYQPAYLDYCHSNVRVKSCHTYPALAANVIAATALPVQDKFNFLVARGLMSSVFVKSMSELYFTTLRPLWLQHQWPEPTWLTHLFRSTSLTSLDVLQKMTQDITQAPRGSVYFYHMMLPHAPYVYTASCQLRENATAWDVNIDPLPILNTKLSLLQRQAQYEQQVQCLTKQVGALLQTLEHNPNTRDAIVMIHGDHGSRIVYHSPDVGNRNVITPLDQLNAYATLFAIKAPISGSISPKTFTPITLIFNDWVSHWLHADLPRQPAGNYVYLAPEEMGGQMQALSIDPLQWYLAANKDYG